MKRIAVPLFAALLVIASVAMLSAQSAPNDHTYTCRSVNFPDGTEGMAVVTVDITAPVPSVFVTVDYFTSDGSMPRGHYEEWVNVDATPRDRYEAERFALVHFFDRW